MDKECPKCSKRGTVLENYCTKCGIQLEPGKNRRSKNRTASCERRVYAADDLFCAYCGALTTYAAGRQQTREPPTA
jgi:hypothetical protein